jgi:hypothetical protein
MSVWCYSDEDLTIGILKARRLNKKDIFGD